MRRLWGKGVARALQHPSNKCVLTHHLKRPLTFAVLCYYCRIFTSCNLYLTVCDSLYSMCLVL